ncbi:MAG: DNA alkylation repair protein [Gammaproteobacteria bacterium]|nr:DNA alkylation repair protein [Gammaproteobacteria bacterium]
MAEPFKNMLNEKVIIGMAGFLVNAWVEFDRFGFVSMATNNLDDLELKERSMQITEALVVFLPDDFDHAARIMLESLAPEVVGEIDVQPSNQGISGWAIMPMVDYVGLYGVGHFDVSMTLFKELTKRSSSELGIRFFLLHEPERTMAVLNTWLNDPNHHVRRLISEGTRPRLPWAMRLPVFIEDPSPVLLLLEALKDDEQEYVRRSVANNLNDIAKDHPDLIAEIAARWLKDADKNRVRLVKHACRTLIKQGHKGALKALGYNAPHVVIEKLEIITPEVEFGEALLFEMSLASTLEHNQNLIIDYAIHHKKANGKTTPKVFKWKTTTLAPSKSLFAKRKHAIKKITTRSYYPGTHHLEIFINGVSFGSKEFELIM